MVHILTFVTKRGTRVTEIHTKPEHTEKRLQSLFRHQIEANVTGWSNEEYPAKDYGRVGAVWQDKSQPGGWNWFLDWQPQEQNI